MQNYTIYKLWLNHMVRMEKLEWCDGQKEAHGTVRDGVGEGGGKKQCTNLQNIPGGKLLRKLLFGISNLRNKFRTI